MSRTILLLEDDANFRRAVVPALESRGLRVLEAAKARDADRLLAQERPDLAIVDGLLPDTNGIKWIEKLRRAGDDLPIVFVSAFYRDIASYKQLTKELGVLAVVHKPVLPDRFAVEVAGLALESASHPSDTFDLDEELVLDVSEISEDIHLAPNATEPDGEPLRASYAEVLPQIVETLVAAVARARSSGQPAALQEALRQAHEVHGTAGSYGFDRVGSIAGRLEKAMRTALAGGAVRWDDVDAATEALSAYATSATAASPRIESESALEPVHLVPRLLVVDDDPAMLEYVARVADRELFELCGAENLEQAWRLAHEKPPDIALVATPLGRPSETARVIAALRESDPVLPVALVALDESLSSRLEAADHGADLFLTHPLDDAELAQALHALYARAKDEPPQVALLHDPETMRLAEPLRARGLDVSIFVDVPSLLESGQPDVVLLGHVPDDARLCRALRASAVGEDAAVVLLASADRASAFLAGADDVLVGLTLGARSDAVVAWAERVRRARRRSRHDPLTSLPLRSGIVPALQAQLSGARRHGQPFSIAVLDVAGMGEINRTRGRRAGDRVLGALSRLVLSRFRLEDVRGRWGGDEVVLGFYNAAPETMAPVVQRLRDELAALEFRGAGGAWFRPQLDAALAGYPEAGDTLAGLFATAGERLARAKARHGLVFRG